LVTEPLPSPGNLVDARRRATVTMGRPYPARSFTRISSAGTPSTPARATPASAPCRARALDQLVEGPPCPGDPQRITGGLLTEMALVMPRTGRRAYILLYLVPGRGNPSVRCRRCDHRLVLTEARQALFMELRIGNRTTLSAHARLAESAICFQEPIVTCALGRS
jgi:hypothetical protein